LPWQQTSAFVAQVVIFLCIVGWFIKSNAWLNYGIELSADLSFAFVSLAVYIGHFLFSYAVGDSSISISALDDFFSGIFLFAGTFSLLIANLNALLAGLEVTKSLFYWACLNGKRKTLVRVIFLSQVLRSWLFELSTRAVVCYAIAFAMEFFPWPLRHLFGF